MELNTAALVGFRTKYETLFNQAFSVAEPQVDKVAVRVDSGPVEQVVHRWLRGLPGMREFLDTRTINNVDSDGLTIKNKEWEDSIGIPRRELERDQHRLYEPMVSRMGQVAKLHRDELAFGLLSDALATPSSYKAYDGDNFFGTHSTKRKTSFSTLGSGALGEGTLSQAITALMNRKDSAGNPLALGGKRPLVIANPANFLTLSKLANLSFIVSVAPGASATQSTSNYGSASENVLKGTFDFITSPYIKTTTEFHVTLQDPLMKPVVFQVEKEVEFLGWDKFLHEWSMNSRFVFGAYARYNVGLGLPEMVWSSPGT